MSKSARDLDADLEAHRVAATAEVADLLTAHRHLVLEVVDADARAVRQFGYAMIVKMVKAQAKGRIGWQAVPVDALWAELRAHVEKGDPVDVANLAMMIYLNSEAQAGSNNG